MNSLCFSRILAMAGFIWDTRWPRSDSVTSWVSGSCYADDSVKITSHRGRTARESDAAEGSQNVFHAFTHLHRAYVREISA
jgi:hypothetical protein